MKRLFIATPIITFSSEIQQSVADLRFRLRHDDIVWVRPELCHLTLRFLGATPPQWIPEIKKTIVDSYADSESVTLTINKIGVFGSRYHPEVLWLGFGDFSPFKALFEKIEPKLQAIGFAPNYGNFVPHITLGRIKRLHDKHKFWDSVEQFPKDFSQKLEIVTLNLYQSFLHKDGPEYKILSSFNL